MSDLVDWRRVELEVYRHPIRLELVRQVIPVLMLLLAAGIAFGYWWAWNALVGN